MGDDHTRWARRSARLKRGDEDRAVVRRRQPARRWVLKAAVGGSALLLVAGLLATLATTPGERDPRARVRADASAAVEALNDGDLPSLDRILAGNRGQTDFAYFFSSKATPRALGNALATVAGDKSTPFKRGVDTHAYDITITDLAGTLALATHGTGPKALPASWTEKFVKATTTGRVAYGEPGEANAQRARQDVANRQNLLLLLSRGYWSTDFLKVVTKAYWDVDHDNEYNPWIVNSLNDAKYAPAPNGTYLIDGVVALSAALTANPEASKWAFTDFRPGTQKLAGSDQTIGKFANYLFFEHRFPLSSDSGGDGSVGMTAALTALSSAISATGTAASIADVLDGEGPMADSLTLQSLAEEATTTSGGSVVAKAWDATKGVAEVVWQWVQRWGHPVLKALSKAPPPFKVVGVAAAATNAVWYSIEGDYDEAGLALVVVVPGTDKIVKVIKAGRAGKKAAAKSDEVADIAAKTRKTVDRTRSHRSVLSGT